MTFSNLKSNNETVEALEFGNNFVSSYTKSGMKMVVHFAPESVVHIHPEYSPVMEKP